MRCVQLFLILLPYLCSAQTESIFIQFTEDDDEFTACHNHYAANGVYEITAQKPNSKFKIPGTQLIVPLQYISDNQFTFSGLNSWARKFGWFEIASPYMHYLSSDEIDTLMKATTTIQEYLNDYSTSDLMKAGIIRDEMGTFLRDSLWEVENLRRAEAQRIEDSIYRAKNGSDYWGGGVLDGLYVVDPGPAEYFQYSDYFDVYPDIEDSVELAHQKIRKEHILPHLAAVFQPFYLSTKEVTNLEYRDFVDWVKDSIARELIYLGIEDDDEASEYLNYTDRFQTSKEVRNESGEILQDEEYDYFDPSNRALNRTRFSLNFDKKFSYNDPELIPILATMYYPQPERFYMRREFDTRRLIYSWYDQSITIYPDTAGFGMEDLVYHTPIFNLYFWHPAFDNYPVLNVNSTQIAAFIHWKEAQINKHAKSGTKHISVSIPTIAQYEFALKMSLGEALAPRTKNLPNSHFTTYERAHGNERLGFLNQVDQSAWTINKQDDLDSKIHKKTFNSWLRENSATPFYYLVGSVSELVSDQVDSSGLAYYQISTTFDPAELHYTIGGNYSTGVKTRSDDSFNALFYKDILRKKESSPYVGFRLVYTLNP